MCERHAKGLRDYIFGGFFVIAKKKRFWYRDVFLKYPDRYNY